MGACLVVTLPLELVLGARVYRRFRLMVLAVLPVVVVFTVWDLIGIARHHWSYNPRFVTGLRLFGVLPVEEVVFFVVVPVCGLLTYEAVGTTMARVRRLGRGRSQGPSRSEQVDA